MHQGRRADDLAAEGLADGLMTETDAQQRNAMGSGRRDQVEADAGLVRVAGPRRQHDGLRRGGQNLIDGDLVVPVDAGLRPKLAQEMDEVVGETVIIIDQQQHGRNPRIAAPEGAAQGFI